jgi:ATP-dependent Lon protease
MATALISALTRRPVRRSVAMTGEITLRGKVLPVGGIKEKVLAAHRAGIKTVILPAENRRDLEEIPANVQRDVKFRFVEHMDEVLSIALHERPRADSRPTSRSGVAEREAARQVVSPPGTVA